MCLRAVYKHVFTKLKEKQSSPRHLSNSHPQKKASASWSSDESAEAAHGRSALALEVASPFSRPGRLSWVTALAPVSQNTFLELASTGG